MIIFEMPCGKGNSYTSYDTKTGTCTYSDGSPDYSNTARSRKQNEDYGEQQARSNFYRAVWFVPGTMTDV